MHSSFSRLCRSPIPRLAVALLVGLALSLLTSCGRNDVGSGDIHDAIQKGNLAEVKALLEDNPNLIFRYNDYGQMPLHSAASTGNKDVVELLLSHKADVNAKTNNGETPLQWAGRYGKTDVQELLRQHGGNVGKE